MPKLKNPLLSFGATGRLGKLFSLAKRQGRHIIERRPIPVDAKSPAQLFNRHMFTKCVDLWHLLSEEEKQIWESLARPLHMTGYAWFISQCLRPNPGIYLPLQGGTMSGNIEMAKNRLLKLPEPTDEQEPVTKKYFQDNLPVGGYTEGARVYHNVAQSIPPATWTPLAFNSERYDTDNIHDPVTNNTRLTCKTPGKYISTGHISFPFHYAGKRLIAIRLNTTVLIALHGITSIISQTDNLSIATIYSLALNDYIELFVYQDANNALNLLSEGNYTPEFTIQRIG